MTHEYTLLVGGTVIPGAGEPDVSAMAWAAGTVIALGSDQAIRAISRGDSDVVDLGGAVVIPLGSEDKAAWPAEATLVVGGPADLAVLDGDPRLARPGDGRPIRAMACLRGGHVVLGALPVGRDGESPPRARAHGTGSLDGIGPRDRPGRAGAEAPEGASG